MTTVDVITALFYEVDEQLRTIPKHPEAHLWPSEVVTLGLLQALVPFDVAPSLRVGMPSSLRRGGHSPPRLEPFLGELLSPSTCIPTHAAQRLCFAVLLSPNAKVSPRTRGS